jgi:protein-S-isoprenylcysteine O-methyltransferase Ste14
MFDSKKNNACFRRFCFAFLKCDRYGGLIISAAGVSLASGDGARLALTVALAVLLDRKASYEEELLEQRYGNAYKTYKGGKAKKLIPWLW